MSSHILTEDEKYVRFDDDGKSQLVNNISNDSAYSYRKVHYTKEDKQKDAYVKKVFHDPEYQITEGDLEALGPRKIVLRRLYDLYRQYPKNKKPQFFPQSRSRFQRIQNNLELPHFVTEIGLFPPTHYRSLFLTQDFSKDGFYHITINQNGRWETDVVDDIVPVYEDSLDPIWGLDVGHAWQIILLKFWAKKNGGYSKVQNMPPFQFIEFFTNSNWKYFNLSREGLLFLDRYTGKQQLGKFVVKTKNSNEVFRSGLIPNSAGYEIIDISEITGHEKTLQKRWNITIRSTLKNKWAGKMSVLDKQVNNFYSQSRVRSNYKMALQRDFIINERDFMNLFSVCWIASSRDKHAYFSNYYLLNVEENYKNSLYLEFNVPKEGWLDYCIKQVDENMIEPVSKKSRMRAEEEQKAQGRNNNNKRYLQVKYLLAKQLDFNEEAKQDHWKDYKMPKFQLYDIEYLRGYNRGDAKFINIVPGRYILKIKTESVPKNTSFIINYSCSSNVEMKEIYPSKQETSMLLRQSLVSLIQDLKHYSLDNRKKDEQILFANQFSNIGYGFVAVRSKKNCPYNLLIEVVPEELRQNGYKLKNQFKKETEPFSILVKPGQSTSLVLNKIDQDKTLSWPPKGITVFKSKQI